MGGARRKGSKIFTIEFELGLPLLRVEGDDLAQHRIHKTCSTFGTARLTCISSELAGGIHCCMVRDAHIQNLMGSHPQDVLEIVLYIAPVT